MPFTSWEIDFELHLATIELRDGRRETFSMPEALVAAGVPFLRSRFDFTSDTLSFTVVSGDVLAVEVGVAGAAGTPPTGRPVVYLDQLHWVSLAKQRNAREKLNEATADAATALIHLAQSKRILPPLSAGHLTEMAHLEGRWREHLGLTLMSLSRGWQMRSPVSVRKAEFLRAMRGRSPRTPGVFTLEPEVLFAATKPSGPATDLPPLSMTCCRALPGRPRYARRCWMTRRSPCMRAMRQPNAGPPDSQDSLSTCASTKRVPSMLASTRAPV